MMLIDWLAQGAADYEDKQQINKYLNENKYRTELKAKLTPRTKPKPNEQRVHPVEKLQWTVDFRTIRSYFQVFATEQWMALSWFGPDPGKTWNCVIKSRQKERDEFVAVRSEADGWVVSMSLSKSCPSWDLTSSDSRSVAGYRREPLVYICLHSVRSTLKHKASPKRSFTRQWRIDSSPRVCSVIISSSGLCRFTEPTPAQLCGHKHRLIQPKKPLGTMYF